MSKVDEKEYVGSPLELLEPLTLDTSTFVKSGAELIALSHLAALLRLGPVTDTDPVPRMKDFKSFLGSGRADVELLAEEDPVESEALKSLTVRPGGVKELGWPRTAIHCTSSSTRGTSLLAWDITSLSTFTTGSYLGIWLLRAVSSAFKCALWFSALWTWSTLQIPVPRRTNTMTMATARELR